MICVYSCQYKIVIQRNHPLSSADGYAKAGVFHINARKNNPLIQKEKSHPCTEVPIGFQRHGRVPDRVILLAFPAGKATSSALPETRSQAENAEGPLRQLQAKGSQGTAGLAALPCPRTQRAPA